MSKQLTVEQGQAIAEQNLIRMYHESQADNARLRARLATMEEALKFYAADESYTYPMIFKECGCVHEAKGWHQIKVLEDDGGLARAALAQEKDNG